MATGTGSLPNRSIRIYEGLGAKAGDRIRGLIGWEYNWTPADIPGLEVVASSPLTSRNTEWAKDQRHHAVVYPCSKGNWVFNAGTTRWAEGLSCPPVIFLPGLAAEELLSASIQWCNRSPTTSSTEWSKTLPAGSIGRKATRSRPATPCQQTSTQFRRAVLPLHWPLRESL